ncbi:MAG: hypothetical protein QME64_12795, partial [bacterium]|nr:hypothetical protein [bacterium]
LKEPEISVHLSRIPILLMQLGQEMLNWKRWNILWFAVVVLLLLYWFEKKDETRIRINAGLLYIVLYLLTIIGIYIISPAFVTYHPGHSLDRVFLHIIPQVVFLIYLFNRELRELFIE